MTALTIRRLADKTSGERIVRYDPDTGEKKLVNPAAPDDDHEPWPAAGIRLEEAPDECLVPTTTVAALRRDGYLSLEGEQAVHRPGGPPGDLWRVTHTFIHADALVFHTVDGDVRYDVVHQPDKYAALGEDDDAVTDEIYSAGETRVDWFYGLSRVYDSSVDTSTGADSADGEG